jgi:Mg-chelatase subunit ChlD
VREEKQWVREFMNLQTVQDDLDSGLLRVGFVSFNKRARVRIPLTSESSRIIGGANRMRGDEVTRINQGLRYAERMLNGSGSRKKEERAKIIVILSDFQFCRRDMRFSSNDVEVVAVGFGVRSADIRNMYQLATKRQYVVDRRNMKQISDIYRYDLALYRPTLLDQLIVRDQLADNMTLVAGSVNPPTVTITGQVIQWQIQQPSDPLTLTYRVEPQEAGVHPISARAEVTWTDTAGLVGNAQFPSASVEVIPPTPTPTPTFTPTPTPTATATSTPTPTPGPRYLPITFKLWPPPTPTMTPLPTPTVCKPSEQIVDVALAIDTSTSMSESTADGKQKLAAAIEAGIELVRLLKSQDQSAVVGFNRVATLASVLTTDKDQAARALLSLPGTQQSGTRIDRGLQESYDEMISPRHRPNASSSIVLVTDGRQMGPIDAVYEIADQIHSRDITLITVGLGTDVDAQLLTDIASRTDDGEPLYFAAPNAEDLLDIYRYIADYIPCK